MQPEVRNSLNYLMIALDTLKMLHTFTWKRIDRGICSADVTQILDLCRTDYLISSCSRMYPAKPKRNTILCIVLRLAYTTRKKMAFFGGL